MAPSGIRETSRPLNHKDGMRRGVDIDAFEYLELLGQGSFGAVFKVTHGESSQPFAMKVLPRHRLEEQNQVKYALSERDAMSQVRHPYIVRLHFAFQTEKHLIMVSTFCGGGNLGRLLQQEGTLSVPLSRHYAAEILMALVHLHERQIIHRDLKCENVVLDDLHHALLTDFGLCKELKEGAATNSFLGSTQCTAPEVLAHQGHDSSIDIYGLGALLYALLTGSPPFFCEDQDKMWSDVQNAPLTMPDDWPEDVTAFVEQTLNRNVRKRCDSDWTKSHKQKSFTVDLHEHRFFESIDFDALLRREVPVPELLNGATFPGTGMPAPSKDVTSDERKRAIFGRTNPLLRGLCCCMKAPADPLSHWNYTDKDVASDGKSFKMPGDDQLEIRSFPIPRSGSSRSRANTMESWDERTPSPPDSLPGTPPSCDRGKPLLSTIASTSSE